MLPPSTEIASESGSAAHENNNNGFANSVSNHGINISSVVNRNKGQASPAPFDTAIQIDPSDEKKIISNNPEDGEIKKSQSRHPLAAVLMRQAKHAERMLHLHPLRIFMLAILAGMLISVGGALSLALSVGDIQRGPQALLQALGFFCGFSMVILTGAALFTEVNVTIAMYLLVAPKEKRMPIRRVLLLWVLVWAGNVIGTMLFSLMIAAADQFDAELMAYLVKIAEKKLTVKLHNPTFGGWMTVLMSAVLGNWMVGIAAFFASKATSIPGQLISIYPPITAFVALGLQHSPANMGYLHMYLIDVGMRGTTNSELGWAEVWAWNIIPATIGNWIGAVVLVAMGLNFVFYKETKPLNSVPIGGQSQHF